jgi:YegS/Rv2252/BmrU family lipid kinase
MHVSNKRIFIIFNPASQGGKSQYIFVQYLSLLENAAIAYECYHTTGQNDDFAIQQALEKSAFTHIAIVGGDGTINLAINALKNKKLPIHILPAGTGNDLAKMIYGKAHIKDITRLILSENTPSRMIDLWKCNERLFANGFGVGFDGAIAYKTANNKSKLPSKLKYSLEIGKQILFYKATPLNINGEIHATFMLSVANGSVYGGGFKVAPDAKIDDKLLEIVHIKPVHTLLRLLFLPLVVFGKHTQLSIVNYSQSDKVTIRCAHPVAAHIDGEPLFESDYHILREGQIEVLC